jgi:hypothetical protein
MPEASQDSLHADLHANFALSATQAMDAVCELFFGF